MLTLVILVLDIGYSNYLCKNAIDIPFIYLIWKEWSYEIIFINYFLTRVKAGYGKVLEHHEWFTLIWKPFISLAKSSYIFSYILKERDLKYGCLNVSLCAL